MPVTGDKIKSEVVNVLCAIARVKPADFTEATKLEAHPFWFTAEMKKALCVPFSNISRQHGGAPISPAETGRCKTVKDCIDLTHTKANTAAAVNAKFTNKFHKHP